jgi:threonine aldolase
MATGNGGATGAARVDLRSDTVTRPSAEMRRVIAAAEVGDAVLGDDPTVTRLEERGAELLGKEACLFFPSGIMANQAALLVLARAGTEVWLPAGGHILEFEEGAAPAWAGVQLRAFSAVAPGEAEVEAVLRPRSRYLPEVSLLCVENTHNSAGGTVLPQDWMQEVARLGAAAGVPLHLDGARLANASAATGEALATLAGPATTVMLSLSKGLGAPVGSLLAGPAEVMQRAWRVRRRLGGGMRQAGLLAAAGLYALENNLERLHEDHARAKRLAEALREVEGTEVSDPQTNIVMLDLHPRSGGAAEVARKAAQRGVLLSPFGERRLRAVTHLDVHDDGIAWAAEVLRELLQE